MKEQTRRALAEHYADEIASLRDDTETMPDLFHQHIVDLTERIDHLCRTRSALAALVIALAAGFACERPPERPSEELWLSAKDLDAVSGWQLSPDGLCRDGVCVPLSVSARQRLLDCDQVCASGLWDELGRPILHDASHSTWVLGEAALDRNRQLDSLEAPDFTLPDITGKLHSLSDYRGRASW